MIELVQHIEGLLLENDCVIIPGFGGFVAHYAPAMRVEEENLFLSPTRTIGFNSLLKMNDGILVQSYMAACDTNFSDATKMVEKDVEELMKELHEDGKCDLGNVGEIHYTIYNTYEFTPYENKITTPYLYGLDSFQIEELAALRHSTNSKTMHSLPREKKTYEIKNSRVYLRNAAAIVATIVLFFFMSVPIENTAVENNNYAQLLPMDIFNKIEKQSVALTPVASQAVTPRNNQHTTSKEREPKTARPIVVKEVKVPHAPEAVGKSVSSPKQTENFYHIIVASVGTSEDAELMTKQLKSQGYAKAKALIGDGKVRVSIMSCATRDEANSQLSKIRENSPYSSAWILVKN